MYDQSTLRLIVKQSYRRAAYRKWISGIFLSAGIYCSHRIIKFYLHACASSCDVRPGSCDVTLWRHARRCRPLPPDTDRRTDRHRHAHVKTNGGRPRSAKSWRVMTALAILVDRCRCMAQVIEARRRVTTKHKQTSVGEDAVSLITTSIIRCLCSVTLELCCQQQ